MKWLLIIPYAALGYADRGCIGLIASAFIFTFVFLEVECESSKEMDRWQHFFLDVVYVLILFGPFYITK